MSDHAGGHTYALPVRAAGGEREQEQSAEQQRGELFHRAASMQNDLLIPMPRARRLCPPAVGYRKAQFLSLVKRALSIRTSYLRC